MSRSATGVEQGARGATKGQGLKGGIGGQPKRLGETRARGPDGASQGGRKALAELAYFGGRKGP